MIDPARTPAPPPDRAVRHSLPRRRPSSVLAVLLGALTLVLAACRDDVSGPGGIRRAFLNVLPVFQPTASLQGTGRNVDTVRVRLQRPGASQPAVDTFFVFPPNADSLVMVLDVPITGGEEEFEAALEMRSQGEVLFSGVQRVRALSASAPGAGQPAQVPIVFVGPGARARTLTLSPRDTVITFGDSIAYRAVALDSAQAPVANAVIAWSADSTFAIGTNGVFRAPNRRGVIRVRARVPAGPADSTTLRIVPRAAALRSQIGLVADTINATVPVAVRVLAADSLGVAGVPVRFATPVGGGTVRDSVVISDSAGVAATTVSYGPVVGLNRVTATVAGVGTVQADVQSRAGVATAVELFGGNAQTATVGDTLPLRLAVRTRDRRGNISPGAAVRVRATSAGTVLDTIITSDSLGVARARARLRVGAGLNTFAARLVADSTQSVSFDATGLPAPASVIVVTGGTSQIVIAGAVAPQPIRAEVRDAFGNVRVGDTVVFTHPGTAKWADSSSVARVVQSATGALSPVFRVSTTAGTDSVVVSAGVLSSRVAVSIIAGPAARLVALSGTGQSAVAGDTLASPLAVLVQDQFANLTSGRVTFAARRLGGTLTPASVDALDGVGLAVSRYRVPTTVGADTVWARLGVLDSVAFPLTVVPGAPTALSIVGGDGQVDTVRAILPTLLAVRATDGNGNAVPNASVRFRVTVGPSATLSNETVAADAGGIARTQLQLPTATGAVQVRAELVADTSRHVVLVAAATPGRAVGATLQSGPSAPYIAGDSLATPFVFSLRDRFGNAVGAGASGRFRWAVGATGRVNGDTASTTLTDAAGQLRAFVRLPSVAGAASLVLQVDTAAVSVALTTVAGAPASLVLLGNATTGTAGGVSSAPIQVRVSDAFGNPIIADTVTFSALRGGPFVDSTAVVRILTNAAGEATSPLVRLSAAAGVDSGIVSIRGLTAIWRTTVTPGTADATQSGWTYAGPAPWAPWAVRLTSLPATPAFVARDVNGNALPGVSVRISTLGPLGNGIGRGTLGGTDTAITVVTDANGEARPPTWVLGELGRSGLRAQAGSVVIDFSATAAPEGTTRAWVGPATAGGNAELTEPSNWLPAGVPSAGDYAFVGPVYQARPRVSSSVSFSPDTMFLYESPIVQAGVTLSLRGQANLLGASFDTTQGTVAFARPGQVIAFVGGLTDTVRLPSVRVDSGAMVVGNAAIAGSLLVRSPLVLTSTTLRVSGPFEVSGAVARLQMLTPNATIRALGGALFDGDSSTNQMDAGLLEVRGRFRQIGTHSAASFRPTGTFRTRFVGSDDSVSFANPAPDARGSGFNVLEMGPQAALTISGSVFANNLGPHGGSSILVPAGASLQFPPFRRLAFESATNVTVNGSLAAACYLEDDGASVNGTGSIPPRCVQALQFVTTPPTLGFVNAPLPSIVVGLVELGGPRAEAGITIRARYLNALNDTVAVLGTDTATTDALGHATFTNLIIPEVLSGARLVFTVANDPLGPTLVTPTTFDVQPPSLLADGPADKITFGPSNGITRQADDLPRLRLEAFGSPVVGAPVTLVPSPAAPSGAQVWPPVATTDGSGVVVLDSVAIGSAAVGTSWYIHYIVGGALVDSAVVRVTPPGVTALWVGGDGATAGENADWQRVGNWKPNAVPDALSHAFRRGAWSPIVPRIDANTLVFPVRTLALDTLRLIRGGIRVVERLDAVVLDSAFLYPGANIFVRLDAGAVGRGVVPELRVGAGAAVTLDGQLQVAGPATLDPGATLDIGNDTLQVQRLSALGGILRMQDAAGYLVVGDSLLFGGDTASATPVLTNGVIDLYGSFDARVGAARQTFRATAPHRVRLLGSRRQTVRMAYGLNGDQRFGVLENAKSSGDTVIFESDVRMDSLVLGANTVTAAVDASVSVALSCVRAPTATVINLPACPGVPSLLTVEAPTDYHVVVPQGGQEGQAGTTAEVNFRLADADNVPIANAGLTIGLVGGVSQVTAAPVLSTDSDGRIRTTVRCTTPGSHGVSATIGGSLTTTARVVCAPAGTSVAWLGAGIDTTDWFGASNWVRYGINSSATDLYPTPDDRVYIPAYGQGRRLAINGATRSVRSWTQEGGALVRLTNAFLNVAGRLVAGDTLSGQGIEGSGEVLLNDSTGTAEASGRLTGVRLRVNAANGYTVSEPLVTDTINVTRGALRLTSPRVSANGMFRVDGLGTLQMQTAGTILRVGNMHWRSSVPGSGLLANGRIFVSGDWRDTSSGSFLPEGAHGVFFVGADQNIVFPVAADTSQRRFAELAFDNTGTVTIGGVVNVGGEFTVGPTVVRVVGSIGPNNVTLNTYGTVQVYGTPDLSGVGTHNAYGGQTPYYDDLAARAPVVTALRRGPVATNGAVQQLGPGIPGTLWVENGSALNVTGAFTVDSSLHVFGGASLQMETVGASLVVGDSLLFNNATPSTLLSEGTLSVGGPLRVIAGDAHALQPTGNFRLRAFRRAGRVAAQEWQFGNFDGVYNLPALINDNAVSSLELSGYDTLVVQTWEAAPNTSLVGIPLSGYDALNFATTCIRGALSEDDFQCAGAPVIADGIAGSGQALTVGQTAPDTLVFRLADANNVGVPQYNVAVGGTERLSVSPITVTDFAGRLKVVVSCTGAGTNYLRVGPINGAPIQFLPDSIAVVCAPTGTTHIWRGLSDDLSTSSNWYNGVGAPSGTGAEEVYVPRGTAFDPVMGGNLAVSALRLELGASFSVSANTQLTVSTALDAESDTAAGVRGGSFASLRLGGTVRGAINVGSVVVDSDLALDGPTWMVTSMTVDPGASLSLGGHQLDIVGGLAVGTDGRVLMTNAADVLWIRNGNLTASAIVPTSDGWERGLLRIENGGFAFTGSAFEPAAGFRFELTGNTPQSASMSSVSERSSFLQSLTINGTTGHEVRLQQPFWRIRDSLSVRGNSILTKVSGAVRLQVDGPIVVDPSAGLGVDTVDARQWPEFNNTGVQPVVRLSGTSLGTPASGREFARKVTLRSGSTWDVGARTLYFYDGLDVEPGASLTASATSGILFLSSGGTSRWNGSVNLSAGRMTLGTGAGLVVGDLVATAVLHASPSYGVTMQSGTTLTLPVSSRGDTLGTLSTDCNANPTLRGRVVVAGALTGPNLGACGPGGFTLPTTSDSLIFLGTSCTMPYSAVSPSSRFVQVNAGCPGSPPIVAGLQQVGDSVSAVATNGVASAARVRVRVVDLDGNAVAGISGFLDTVSTAEADLPGSLLLLSAVNDAVSAADGVLEWIPQCPAFAEGLFTVRLRIDSPRGPLTRHHRVHCVPVGTTKVFDGLSARTDDWSNGNAWFAVGDSAQPALPSASDRVLLASTNDTTAFRVRMPAGPLSLARVTTAARFGGNNYGPANTKPRLYFHQQQTLSVTEGFEGDIDDDRTNPGELSMQGVANAAAVLATGPQGIASRLLIAGPTVLTQQVTAHQNVRVEDSLRLNGHLFEQRSTAASDPWSFEVRGNGVLVMTSFGDELSTTRPLVFDGARSIGHLARGVITAGSSVEISSRPEAFRPDSALHLRLVRAYAGTQQITVNPAPLAGDRSTLGRTSIFNDVRLSGGATIFYTMDVGANGTSAVLSVDAGAEFIVRDTLRLRSGGTVRVDNATFVHQGVLFGIEGTLDIGPTAFFGSQFGVQWLGGTWIARGGVFRTCLLSVGTSPAVGTVTYAFQATSGLGCFDDA